MRLKRVETLLISILGTILGMVAIATFGAGYLKWGSSDDY